MITGSVNSSGRAAIIPLKLFGNSSGQARQAKSIRAVVDTGFTDRLTLPPEIVEELNLPFRGSVDATLADGSIETLPIYRVRLLWHGQERTILAYAASGEPLVGMALLSRSELLIETVAGGTVQIKELPSKQSGYPGR